MLFGISTRAQSASSGISVCLSAVSVLFIFLVNFCEPLSETKRYRYYGIILYGIVMLRALITRLLHTLIPMLRDMSMVLLTSDIFYFSLSILTVYKIAMYLLCLVLWNVARIS